MKRNLNSPDDILRMVSDLSQLFKQPKLEDKKEDDKKEVEINYTQYTTGDCLKLDFSLLDSHINGLLQFLETNPTIIKLNLSLNHQLSDKAFAELATNLTTKKMILQSPRHFTQPALKALRNNFNLQELEVVVAEEGFFGSYVSTIGERNIKFQRHYGKMVFTLLLASFSNDLGILIWSFLSTTQVGEFFVPNGEAILNTSKNSYKFFQRNTYKFSHRPAFLSNPESEEKLYSSISLLSIVQMYSEENQRESTITIKLPPEMFIDKKMAICVELNHFLSSEELQALDPKIAKLDFDSGFITLKNLTLKNLMDQLDSGKSSMSFPSMNFNNHL